MALRPYWKGYLRLSLVTCPVNMTPATSESEEVRFHTLNKDTGNRVVSQYIDSITGKPVKDENEAKGYARIENDYVILTEDDLDNVALDTVKTIDIAKFAPADSIEWVYLEKPHYLMPDDAVGNEAFAVIRDAMKADKVVGDFEARHRSSREGGGSRTPGRRNRTLVPAFRRRSAAGRKLFRRYRRRGRS